jgi:hypothetical protein
MKKTEKKKNESVGEKWKIEGYQEQIDLEAE